MKTEFIDIQKIIPYARNPRKNDNAVDKEAASLKEFGWQQPIVVDKDMIVIVGHTRLKAAHKLQMKEVPIHIAKDLTKAQAKAYRLTDNRVNEEASWDDELLKFEFEELTELDFDLSLTGFDNDELSDFIGENEGLTDDDQAPDLPDEPITKLGDLYILGNHRLLCGDSTLIDDVEKLMDGQKADMVFTDPPYNVSYSGRGMNNLGTIKNDDMSDDDFEQFCRDFFISYNIAMKPLGIIYVCHQDSLSGPKIAFEKTFNESFRKSSTIIWLKQSAGMGWQDYRAQHEPILYGWKEGKGSHFFCGDRSKTTVWQINRDNTIEYKHPTQKPVSLPEEAIKNSSIECDVVLDLFGGSGSTLIACEKTNRNARLMELDPKYCDVIVKRWEDYTGKKAETKLSYN